MVWKLAHDEVYPTLGPSTSWESGLRGHRPKAGLPDASGVRCPHFDVESFVANKQERRLLNNFRTQCSYCQKLRASKRSREICEEARGL